VILSSCCFVDAQVITLRSPEDLAARMAKIARLICNSISKAYSIDINVFDIQQGVAISIFVKHKVKQPTKVFHADLWGKRDGKYAWLEEKDIKTTDWKKLEPCSPFYLFIPQDTVLRDEYEQYWKVTDMMPINSVGIVTARDNLTIHESPLAVMETVKDFVSLEPEQAREKYQLGEDVRDWKVHLAQEDIRNNNLDDSYVSKNISH
jgi:hypothetical protein